jgi:signal transduction histidine kinase
MSENAYEENYLNYYKHIEVPLILFDVSKNKSIILFQNEASEKFLDDKVFFKIFSIIDFLKKLNSQKPILERVFKKRMITTKYHLSVSFKLIENNRAVVFIEDKTHDVMKRKKIEVEVQELESFNSSVCHDLRTPLHLISGYCELVFDEIHDEKIKPYLNIIKKNITKMNKLINDLTELARISKASIDISKINVTEIFLNKCEFYSQVNSGVDYKISFEKNIEISGDISLIEILIDNLVNNAFKYSRHNKNPIIKLGFLSSQTEKLKTFYIKDNGVGFSADEEEDVFKPFVRLHDQEKFQGTGIGLTTVKRIVEKHNARIWYESKPDIGTTVYLSFPC